MMHIVCERLFEQLRRARSNGVVIGRDNLVSAAHLVAHDEAETWRDVAGMLRIRLRVQVQPEPDRMLSAALGT
jgi:hypothetical protein